MNPALTIVVPLCNSSAIRERLISELPALKVEGGCELAPVNGGGRDHTTGVCKRLMRAATRPGIRLISNS